MMRKTFPLSALLSGLMATPLLAGAPRPEDAPVITVADTPREVFAAQLPAYYHSQAQLIVNGQPLNTYGMQALNRRIAEDMQARLSQLLENGALPGTFNIQFNAPQHMAQRTEKAAFLGINASPVSGALTAQLPLPRGMGLLVEFVQPDSPASAAGLQVHDVLEKLDDQLLINPQQLAVLVRAKHPGDSINLTILRAGKESTLSAKLIEKELPVLESLQEPNVWITPNLGQMTPYQVNPAMPGNRDNRVNNNQLRGTRASVRVDSNGTETRTLTDEENDITITKPTGQPEHIVIKDNHGDTLYDGDGTDNKIPAEALPKINDLRQRNKIAFDHPSSANGTPKSVSLTREDADHQITIRGNDAGRTLTVIDSHTGKVLFDGAFKTADDLKNLPQAVQDKVKDLSAKAGITDKGPENPGL